MAVAAILHFSLEPADYRVEIHKQTAAALTLLEEAVTGNDEGQYSEDAVLALQTSLDRANELADSALSTTDDLRNCYAQIKKDIKTFKGQENRLCVSANQLEALQEENVDFTQTIKIDGIGEIVWRLPCKEMGQAGKSADRDRRLLWRSGSLLNGGQRTSRNHAALSPQWRSACPGRYHLVSADGHRSPLPV